MPICSDPQREPASFHLDIDEPIAEAERPTWLARFITCRQSQRIAELMRSSADAEDPEGEVEAVLTAISLIVVGWRNVTDAAGQTVDFDLDRLPDLLTNIEIWELMYKAIGAVKLDEIAKKKYASPPTSEPAMSVATAQPADAGIDPAPPTP